MLRFNLKIFLILCASAFGANGYAALGVGYSQTYANLEERIANRHSHSTAILLGSKVEGRSTLLNLLVHLVEYATFQKTGNALMDRLDLGNPIFAHDVFADNDLSVVPEDYVSEKLSESFTNISTIPLFMPVLGPTITSDFQYDFAENSFDLHYMEPAKIPGMSRPTFYAVAYSPQNKVKNPVFQTTLIDTRCLEYGDNISILQRNFEAIPEQNGQLNAFIIVMSSSHLVSEHSLFKSQFLFDELKKILQDVDPNLNRVFLAITHATDMLSLKIVGQQDPRRVVAEKFKMLTTKRYGDSPVEDGLVIPTERIFFFENKYNNLSEDSIHDLYQIDSDELIENACYFDAKVHRVKNYQLNLFEAFRLLKAIEKKEPISRRSLLKSVEKLQQASEQASSK